MEPKLPTPDFNPDQLPIQHGEIAPTNIEQVQPVLEAERPVGEVEPRPVQVTPVLPAPVAIPVVPQQPTQLAPTAQPVADDDTPLVAGDDDLIEKEWVDKAKQIIAETRDDPHRREQEVSRLQADYLKKRYGKDLGAEAA